jgi:hypothetical protein
MRLFGPRLHTSLIIFARFYSMSPFPGFPFPAPTVDFIAYSPTLLGYIIGAHTESTWALSEIIVPVNPIAPYGALILDRTLGVLAAYTPLKIERKKSSCSNNLKLSMIGHIQGLSLALTETLRTNLESIGRLIKPRLRFISVFIDLSRLSWDLQLSFSLFFFFTSSNAASPLLPSCCLWTVGSWVKCQNWASIVSCSVRSKSKSPAHLDRV